MPYIAPEKRGYRTQLTPKTAGELNYAITCLILEYLDRAGERYETLNAIDGVLGLVQHEFRRRVIDPYEDKKIAENGDIYPG
jgi:hypothetical protein